jgi:hypothetical protein
MQTSSPDATASLAVFSEWSISRGRNSEEIGMAFSTRANGLTHANS